MNSRTRDCVRSFFAALIAALALLPDVAPIAQAGEPEDSERYFSEQVMPILAEHCLDCHSHASGESGGGLMLDSLAAMTIGGSRGRAVVASQPDQSLLLTAVGYADTDLQMPPEYQLPENQVSILRQWIASGAEVPQAMRGDSAAGNQSATTPTNAGLTHWAYQPPQPWQPTLNDGAPAGDANFVDAIIREQLQAAGLELSPRASRGTLIRRLNYDLTGLPPSPQETAAFLSDPRSDDVVIEELISRLLGSPQFGERWARYWMDIARYADNKGYVFQEDREYPEAFRYRDWLITAFNSDMPYDQFVTQQLSADLQPDETPAVNAQADNLPALGFLTLGRRFLNNKYDIIDDRLDVVSRGLMGLTLACARCHDHKYDPISQADYYSMAGVFLNTEEPGGEPWPHRLADSKEERAAHILIRGNARSVGEKVDRRFVRFLAPQEPAFQNGSGRRELAACITSPDNPLTARVMANRIWLQLTGSSLVESPSDLGLRCPPPHQAALLDQLAIEFVQSGWSMKHLIRLIISSEVYQQQSDYRQDGYAADPENRLYWRMNRRRLDFESLRDTLLSRSGQLESVMYGPAEKIATSPFSHRRTVYAYIDRQNLPSVFRTFDLASPDSHSPMRAQTSVPQQGLYMLNSEFISQLAGELERRSDEAASRTAARAEWMFERIYCRRPSAEELEMLVRFVENQPYEVPATPVERWICGYAEFDPQMGGLRGFNRLPGYFDSKWQGGQRLPDESLGWCILSAEGGHPGNDLQHAVVRRWIAPRAGRIAVDGKLKHSASEGDGVRGSILLTQTSDNTSTLQKQWEVHNQQVNTKLPSVQVAVGEALDFVCDCRTEPSNDSFEWKVRVRYTDEPGENFRSEQDFPAPIAKPLGVWAQLAIALLSTNELAYID